VLAQGTHDPSEAAPLLAELLSIPTGDRYPSLDLTPQKRKERTLHAQVAQVEGLAARQPVLMVYEDMQWSDPTTRESLDLLIDRVPTLRVLAIITFRPEFAPPWVGHPHVTMLNLNRLPPRRRAEMIMQVTGGKALPREIADQIVDRTDGVPLFIEELTKAVLESGVLTETDDCYAVTGVVAPLAIPTTLHASLLARLDSLAPTREVAQIAAALGRQFSHELMSAVATIPKQQLDDALAMLVRAELIFRRGTPPDAEYTFKHALVQDAAYETLLRSRRQQLHSQIAATLERRFPEIVNVHPEVLARHWTEAGSVKKAVSYWLKAGQQAVARCAMIEAVARLRKGIDLCCRAPDAGHEERELDLQMALGNALLATQGYAAPEYGAACARARQLCKELNQPQKLRWVLVGQFSFRLLRGELDQAERHVEEMYDIGGADDRARQANAVVCMIRGKFVDARADFENGLSWRPVSFGIPPSARIVGGYFAQTLLYLGYANQARLWMDKVWATLQQLSPYDQVFMRYHAWHFYREIEGLGCASTMLRSAEEVAAISSEQGFALQFAFGRIMRGWCLGALGKAAEGIPSLLDGIAIWRSTGANLMTPFNLMLLAEIYGIAAQPEEGLARLAEAAELVETTQERWAEAELHRLRGTLFQSLSAYAAAEGSYYQALAVARRQSAKFWELRAATSLARFWRDQGKRTEARDLLAPIYGWFTEGLDTPVLKEAKALLEQLAP
jgi:predicted ATPase